MLEVWTTPGSAGTRRWGQVTMLIMVTWPVRGLVPGVVVCLCRFRAIGGCRTESTYAAVAAASVIVCHGPRGLINPVLCWPIVVDSASALPGALPAVPTGVPYLTRVSAG